MSAESKARRCRNTCSISNLSNAALGAQGHRETSICDRLGYRFPMERGEGLKNPRGPLEPEGSPGGTRDTDKLLHAR